MLTHEKLILNKKNPSSVEILTSPNTMVFNENSQSNELSEITTTQSSIMESPTPQNRKRDPSSGGSDYDPIILTIR